MRLAETVTFGGSGLDRAAHLRADVGRQAELRETGRILPLWRGKPLMTAAGGLGWVVAGSPVLAESSDLVFLGFDNGQACFAADISGWVPDADATLPGPGFLDPTEQHHPAVSDDWVFAELRAAMLRLTAREAEMAATAKAVLHWHRTHGFCSVCGAKSDSSMAGWQRTCPSCAAHHFPRTDPVVIMLVTHANRVLMGRSPGWPEGMYSCLAGFVEPGETIEAAVRREVLEEAGVQIGAVRYLASQPWPFPASLMIGCAAEALTDSITIDPSELEHALWLTREDMVAVMADQHPQIRPARKGAIAHFLIQNWLADRLD